MSGNYARDRCFCSKNTRPLCETCAWFAKDTHPTLSPFGASVGDRCGSQNRYWHSLLENRCLTPGRDADATGSRTIRRWGRVGSSEGGAAALEQSDYTSTAAHTDRGSRSRSRVAPTMTPAPTPTPSPSTRARSPTTAALELRATKVRRCAESVDRFSPARTGFRAGGTRYCDASRPSAAVPQKRFAKSSASKRATSDESDASWGDAEQSLLASDGTGFAWVDGSDAPPSDPMEMAVHIGLAEVLSAIKRNTPVAYIYSSAKKAKNYSTEWALDLLALTGDAGIARLKSFRTNLGLLATESSTSKRATLDAIAALRGTLRLTDEQSLLRELYWKAFRAECDRDGARPQKSRPGYQMVRISDISVFPELFSSVIHFLGYLVANL